jgi:hypothetical protein
MRFTICLTAAVALACVGSTPLIAKPVKNVAFQLKGTSWTFTDAKLGKVHESVDADGNYITETAGGKHLDHGTSAMKDGKACFTSAMTKDGEVCWTTMPVGIGHAMATTSSDGRKLKVTRVKYVKLSMPK